LGVVSVSILGNSVSVSFGEIMMVMSAVTLLLALVPPFLDPNGFNPLALPGSFIASFNYLWFNDFKFLGDAEQGGTCLQAISSLDTMPALTNVAEQIENSTLENATMQNLTEDETLNTAVEDAWWSFIPFQSALKGFMEIPNSVIQKTADFSDFFKYRVITNAGDYALYLVNVVIYIFNILVGCGFNGVRFVIGASIAVYWLYMSSGILGGLANFLSMLMKIFGG